MAISVRTVLERNLLFRGLLPATLDQIARLCVRRTYAPDAIIFSIAGSLWAAAKSLYLTAAH